MLNMSEMWYDFKGDVLDVLKGSGLRWAASGDLAVGIMCGEKVSPPYLIYVSSDQQDAWAAYLKQKGAVESVSPVPALHLIPKDLTALILKKKDGFLLVDEETALRTANPRFLESL